MKGSMNNKAWWKLSRAVLLTKKGMSSIPPLKNGTEWVKTAIEKADLFATTFAAKNVLIPQLHNPNWSDVQPREVFNDFIAIRTRTASKLLRLIDESSATGPDTIPGAILKKKPRNFGGCNHKTLPYNLLAIELA